MRAVAAPESRADNNTSAWVARMEFFMHFPKVQCKGLAHMPMFPCLDADNPASNTPVLPTNSFFSKRTVTRCTK